MSQDNGHERSAAAVRFAERAVGERGESGRGGRGAAGPPDPELVERPKRRELYPDVVDAPEEEGGVPSRLIKTDRCEAAKEGTPWKMFAGSPSGRAVRRLRSR